MCFSIRVFNNRIDNGKSCYGTKALSYLCKFGLKYCTHLEKYVQSSVLLYRGKHILNPLNPFILE